MIGTVGAHREGQRNRRGIWTDNGRVTDLVREVAGLSDRVTGTA